MKITSVLILILFISETITAQTEKGNFLINGSVGLDIQHRIEPHSNIAEEKSIFLSLSPVAGYFFQKDLAAGLQLNYHYMYDKFVRNTNTGIESQITTMHRIGGGPFLKWYIPVVNKVSFFTHANVSYYSFGEEDWQISTALKPGLALFITNKIGIELSTTLLNYEYRRISESNRNNFFFGLNLSNIQLGVSFYL